MACGLSMSYLGGIPASHLIYIGAITIENCVDRLDSNQN